VTDFAKRVLKKIDELEDEHTAATKEVYAARLERDQLHSQDQTDPKVAAKYAKALKRAEKAEAALGPKGPHQDSIIKALYAVLQEDGKK
jgi:hypothetical protein